MLCGTILSMPYDSETNSLPPQLQQIGDAPRFLSFFSRLYLRLCSGAMPFFGWGVAAFGFMLTLFAAGVIGMVDAIPRNWLDVGKGRITNVQETNRSVGGKRGRGGKKLYAYRFEVTDGEAEKISGISYGFKGKYEMGNEVTVQKSGKRYCVQGLMLTGVPADFPLIFFGMGSLFGVTGLCFMVFTWLVGGKTIRCLQDGTAIVAKYIGLSPSQMNVNNQPVMKADFEYRVDGKIYTASAPALDTSRLTDSKYKAVLYDPQEPKRSVVLDGLPSGIRLDERTGQFSTNPLRLVLPLFATMIVGAEIVALVVLVIRAI